MTGVELTDQNFENEVLKSEIPVLVDFYADWCGPCKMIAPSVDEISKEYEGKLRIGKLNVDNAGVTAQKYGVMGIPTLMVFKNGQVAGQLVGYQAKDAIKRKIEEILALS